MSISMDVSAAMLKVGAQSRRRFGCYSSEDWLDYAMMSGKGVCRQWREFEESQRRQNRDDDFSGGECR
jgi:hypothetical protein